jgi:hypothetical protein
VVRVPLRKTAWIRRMFDLEDGGNE